MQTEQMIAALVADSETRTQSLGRQIATAIVPVVVLTTAGFYLVFGLRDDLSDAFSQTRFVFKLAFMTVLSIMVWRALINAARPTPLPRSDWVVLIAALLVLVVALGLELYATPPVDWTARLYGANAVFCVIAIPTIGLPILALALFALRGAAPRKGTLAGCMAGLFAGVMAGAIYAVHCPDDSPLFMVAWYGLSITGLAGLGALVGHHLLRW